MHLGCIHVRTSEIALPVPRGTNTVHYPAGMGGIIEMKVSERNRKQVRLHRHSPARLCVKNARERHL